jgi:hypothetical protein
MKILNLASIMLAALVGFSSHVNADITKEFNQCVDKCIKENTKDKEEVARFIMQELEKVKMKWMQLKTHPTKKRSF